MDLKLSIEVEREDDGRWIADVIDLPGVMTYGGTKHEAIQRAVTLSLARLRMLRRPLPPGFVFDRDEANVR